MSEHLREVRVLTLAAAKSMAAAAEAFALARGWTVAIAVPASREIAVEKARSAARLRRPTAG
jgi:uncharacterized protein GlcG (DUF336 family)